MPKDQDLAQFLDKVHLGDDDFFKKGTRSGKLGIPGSATDKANRATQDQVLDPRTRMMLLRMINKGVFDELRACISTGKEANVYRGVVADPPAQYAVKVYKTAILAFKDRERYVTGEYRFRFGYSKSNPRKMVKLWAEKETRNLKRIWRSDIPVPKPLHLDHHVLVMEFLGQPSGWPSPRLKDADIEPERYAPLYRQLLSYMRILYQECRLVHADLSEYNILYHEEKLWIIDVSQSVEHDHPRSLEFLRMDIKNVNDYFAKRGVDVFGERQLFEFITTKPAPGAEWPEKSATLVRQLEAMPRLEVTEQLLSDDAVFRNVYIPRNLNDVFDIDRDVERVREGEKNELIYGGLLRDSRDAGDHGDAEAERANRIASASDQNNENGSVDSADSGDSDGDSGDSDGDSDIDDDDDDDDSSDEITDVWDSQWEETRASARAERKFLDRDANKERKQQIKQEKKEKRASKLKKKDKKRLVAASKTAKKGGRR